MTRPEHAPAISSDATWLVRLRWAMAAAQILSILFIDRQRGSHLHLQAALTFVAVGAASNVAFALWLRRARAVREATLGLLLAFDVVLLTAILTEGGGYSSPLSFLYMVEVAIAAVALGRVWSTAIIAMSFACSLALIFHHSSEGGHHHDGAATTASTGAASSASSATADVDLAHREHAMLHLEGMWISFAVIGFFVARVKRALAQREAELAAERALAARNEKLASLATLAAGAAHELATPLATIATAAKELERNLTRTGHGNGDDAVADARLVRDQVERCRGILNQMAADAGASVADASVRLGVEALFRRTLDDFAWRDRITTEISPAAAAVAFEAPPLALSQALRSALRNAVEASPDATPVRLSADADGDSVRIEIADRGEGMRPEVLARAGEPFFTTKDPGRGMGLGLFLTRTVIERLGGSLRLDSGPSRGTTAVLALPIAGAATKDHAVPPAAAG